MNKRNLLRARSAKVALKEHVAVYGRGAAMQYLLADLRHYCDKNRLNFAEQDAMAYDIYAKERNA